MAAFTERDWTGDFLTSLHVPLSPSNINAALAWVYAEGGHFHNTATFNPLNTSYNGYGGISAFGTHIKAYPTYEAGMSATLATINNGKYPEILAALARGNDGLAVITSIGQSVWGTSLALIRQRYEEMVVVAKVNGGYTVLPHVQAFANACQQATGATSFGTYAGHDPTPERAMDIFHAVGDDALADSVCTFFIDHYSQYGGWYVISRQHIWNPNIASYWRDMADRGSITQNHYDHVHVSFEESAAGTFTDIPTEEDELTGEEKAQLRYTKDAVDEIKNFYEEFASFGRGNDAWEAGRDGLARLTLANDERSKAALRKLDIILKHLGLKDT